MRKSKREDAILKLFETKIFNQNNAHKLKQ